MSLKDSFAVVDNSNLELTNQAANAKQIRTGSGSDRVVVRWSFYNPDVYPVATAPGSDIYGSVD